MYRKALSICWHNYFRIEKDLYWNLCYGVVILTYCGLSNNVVLRQVHFAHQRRQHPRLNIFLYLVCLFFDGSENRKLLPVCFVFNESHPIITEERTVFFFQISILDVCVPY